MSTMRVTTLKNESSTVDQIVLNADGSIGGELGTTLGSKLPIAGGKILQIVRATDTTQRTTTSNTFVDVTGMTVTITPQKSDSAVIVLAAFYWSVNSEVMTVRLTDSSNNALSGAQSFDFGESAQTSALYGAATILGYVTPATTSAVTYKLRFQAAATRTAVIQNGISTGQMYAIEVSA